MRVIVNHTRVMVTEVEVVNGTRVVVEVTLD